MDSLLKRYCPPDMETVRRKRARRGLEPLTDAQEMKERREIKEARRQIEKAASRLLSIRRRFHLFDVGWHAKHLWMTMTVTCVW